MATHSGAVTSSDAQYRQGYSSKLYYDGIVANPLNKFLTENSVINREDDLSKNQGGTVTLYNRLRLDGKLQRGDVDFYSLAEQLETSSRTISIEKISKPITWYMKGSQTEQFTAYSVDDGTQEAVTDYLTSAYNASLINHLAANNASSITLPQLDSTVFTGSDLTTVTGNNAVAAPVYWYEANLGGVITTDAGVTSGNTLSLKDFQTAVTNITGMNSGQPIFSTFKNKDYLAIAIISYTGYYQLENEAVTLGQGPQITEYTKAAMAGGDKTKDMRTFQVPGIPLLFVVVPDHQLPRGVTTSGLAETANTRRAVIVGRHALDMAFGAGYAGGKIVPGMNYEIDTNHKKLNKMAYGNASMLWGCKRITATGSGGATSGESTYVITHYSAT